MTIFTLKIIALLSMFIDHSAYLDFSKSDTFYYSLRIIGRISFPIYIFIITESLYYTKNRNKFLKDLFKIGLISQLPFYLYFGGNLSDLNVLFTLFFGSLIVYNIDNLKNSFKNKNITALTLSLLFPLFINVDYGFIGVYAIPILYYLKKLSKNNNIVSSSFTFLLCAALYYDGWKAYLFASSISAVLILFYNKKEGKKFKTFFQISYPLHLIIYLLINIFILNKIYL